MTRHVLIAALALLPAAGPAALRQTALTAVADTYVQRGAPTNNWGADKTFLVKRDFATNSGSTDRLAFLRYNESGLPGSILSASAIFTITAYPGDGVSTQFTYNVYGLPDGHANEAFVEANLTYASAINGSNAFPGSFNPSNTVFLGTFTPTNQSTPQSVELTNAALATFLNTSTNEHATLVIVRETPNTGLPTTFAAREAATLTQRPTILAYTADFAHPVSVVTASSTLDTNTSSRATNAIDDDFTTRWIAAADTVSTNRAWLRLDFGVTQTVNRVQFTPFQNGRSYHIDASTNGTTWTTLATNVTGLAGTSVNTLKQPVSRYFQPRAARYVRITSLTTTTGNSASFWDAQAALDTNAAPALLQLTNLTASVSALTTNTVAETAKRVVLEVALERAQSALDVGELAYASTLLGDVDAHLTTNAATMAAVATNVAPVTVLRPLLATTTNTNPYIRRLVNGATLSFATNEPPVVKATLSVNPYADAGNARVIAWQMDGFFWLYAHTNSPLAGNAESLRRLLRRFNAFTDVMDVHSATIDAGQLSSIYDDFCMGPASTVLREFALLYPGLLLPSQRAQWTSAVQQGGALVYAANQDRVASWVNTDVAIAVELFNFGTVLTNQAMLDKAEYFVNDIFASQRNFADGAVGYIGTQNEAGGYQNTVSEYASRYYHLTGSTNALTLLQGMEWYGPINGRIADWWTSPSWKRAWNDINSTFQGGEPAAGTNPYVRAELDAEITNAATASNWYSRPRVDIAWYQAGVPTLARPDYTTFDRNIQGPRAWNGRFNYAGTLRLIDPSESGHSTLMGCQAADPDPNFRVNACLMDIAPRLRINPGPSRDPLDGTFDEPKHSWLTSRLTGSSLVTRDVSTLAASYLIHSYGSSVKGTETNWTGLQVWLNLPDRIVGLLDLQPNQDLHAYEVQGFMRLGFGGTAFSAIKTLVTNGPGSWTYGDLGVRLHTNNFASVDTELYAFRNPNAPITEITLRDQIGGASNTNLITYPAGTRRFWITEIRHAPATGDVTVTEISAPGGLIGLEVDHPALDRRYRVVYNPTTNTAAYNPALAWSGTVRLLTNGQTYRPGWLPAPTGPVPSTYLTNLSPNLVIPPGGHLLLERVGTIQKAANTSALDEHASWTEGSLADAALAVFDSTFTGTNLSLGGGFNFAGLVFANPATNLTLTGASNAVLALGPLGLDAATSSRTLTLLSAVRLDAPQTWTTGTGSPPYSAQIVASGIVSGPGSLTLAASTLPPRAVLLGASNVFTGDLTLASNSAVLIAFGSTGAAGTLTNSPLGLGSLTLESGSSLLASGNVTLGVNSNRVLRVNGDFAVGQVHPGGTNTTGTGRVELAGALDLGGATRTVSLGRVFGSLATAANGSNPGLRLGTYFGIPTTVTNGSLRVVRDPDTAATNHAGIGFGLSSAWFGGSGLILGSNVVTSFASGFAFNTSNAWPTLTLEPGAILNVSDGGGAVRTVTFRSLSGTGLVANFSTTNGIVSRTSILTLNSGTHPGTNSFDGVLRDRDTSLVPLATNGVLALTKSGPGTQVLTGPHTYSGPTTLSGGTLVLHGNQSAATGAVLVSATATLAGTGTVGGVTTFAPGAVHAPGPGPGLQRFANSVVYQSGSELQWELTADASTGAVFDTIRLAAGTLTIATGTTARLMFNAPSSTVRWTNAFWGSTQRWAVFTATLVAATNAFASLLVSDDSAGAPLSALGGTFAFTAVGTNVFLDYTPPAPLAFWRYQQFGATNNSGPAADSADPDGDGLTNAQEFHAGTAPLSAADTLHAPRPRFEGSALEFDIDARADRRYHILRSTNLLPDSWSVVGGPFAPAPTNRTLVFSDPAPPTNQAYYRLQADRP